MTRVFRPITVIPPELYVERAADRQLEVTVQDMGRPGYILVARQMGKTNLLFNLKRSREMKGDLVLYFDLSLKFETAQNLFRYIIDNLLDACDEDMDELRDKIEQQRTKIVEPNLEYDRHLRLLLKAIKDRKVIIILDEVDSLINVQYSDSFFAQIRSMYFSRINYSEYERLTYVLSGVAEPTDLIKDKNISPFNIGEKIYLDDFSTREFENLISKSNLAFGSEVVAEVYNWTRGNPRMSWDLCSDLEALLRSQPVNVANVRESVDKLYLRHFDRAPVDHVRVIAANDPEIRNAIMAIRWDKAHTLSDVTKNRLYLAGITSFSDSGLTKIKNPIIDLALSDAWLDQVAISQKGLKEVASDHFKAGQYDQAIQLYEFYKVESGTENFDAINSYELGIAYYSTKQFEKAIDEFNETFKKTQSEEFRAGIKYYIGISQFRNDQVLDSIKSLREAALTRSEMQNNARLSLASTILSHHGADLADEAISISNSIIDDYDTVVGVRAREADRADYISSAYFNIYQAFRLQGRSKAAGENLLKAFEMSPLKFRPAISYFLRGIDLEITVRRGILKQIVDDIISQQVRLSKYSPSQLDFSEYALGLLIISLYEADLLDHVNRLVVYATHKIYSHSRTSFEMFVHLFRSSDQGNISLAPLLSIALDHFDDKSVLPEQRLAAIRLAVSSSSTAVDISVAKKYVDIIHKRARENSLVDFDDVYTMLGVIGGLVDTSQYGEAVRAIHAVKNLPNAKFNWMYRVLVLRYEMLSHYYLFNLSSSREIASEILSIVYTSDIKLGDIKSESLRRVIVAAQNQAKLILTTDPNASSFNIGRNTWVDVRDVITLQQFRSKFKNVEKELSIGVVEII